MIGQHGRGQSGSEVSLSECKFDHHGLLFPRGPCAPASIGFFFPFVLVGATSIVYPIPLRNSFRFLCNKFKKLQHYCLFIFLSFYLCFIFLFEVIL